MAQSTCCWKDASVFLRPKGILKEAEGGGDSGLLHVCWVDWNLLAALPLVNIERNCAIHRLWLKIRHVGQ